MKHRFSFEVEETQLVWAITLLSQHKVNGLAVSVVAPEAAPKQAGVNKPIEETASGMLALAFLREHGTVDREAINNYFAANGYSEKTGGATLSKLTAAGFLEKIGRGTWRIK